MEPPSLNAPILVIKKEWLDLILDGAKTLEVRGCRCTKEVGTFVYLSQSKTGTIAGRVRFDGCSGPLELEEFMDLQSEHKVSTTTLPYSKTFVWRFSNPIRSSNAIPYKVRKGSVIWRKFSAPSP